VSQAEETSKPRRKWLALLPVIAFLALAGLFLTQLLSGRDAAVIPSALIGAEAPATDLPPLEGTGLPGLSSAAFAGKVTVVNVFASWCAPCRQEHPLLMQLSQDKRITLAALNYKDTPENALRFLGGLGNPFAAIGVDGTGAAAINWGVYGVPETFLVGKDGRIAFKHVGPFTPQSMQDLMLPEIEKALAK
jgi:cytochrome c biogenesis protein CcmG/thiol:disulfide interchange protein DsbE